MVRFIVEDDKYKIYGKDNVMLRDDFMEDPLFFNELYRFNFTTKFRFIFEMITFTILFLSFTIISPFVSYDDTFAWIARGSLILFLIAMIFELIFVNIKKSHNLKFKIKHKNMVLYYVSCLLFAIGSFCLFGGLFFVNYTFSVCLGFNIILYALSIYAYHRNTFGKSKLRLKTVPKIIFIITIICVSYISVELLDMKYHFMINMVKVEEADFDKKNLVTFDTATLKPSHFVVNGKRIYSIIRNNDNSESIIYSDDYFNYYSELFDSGKGFSINGLQANDYYVVWAAGSSTSVNYYYYDIENDKVHEFASLVYNKQDNKFIDMGLYKDKIYYKMVDSKKKVTYFKIFSIIDNTTDDLLKINEDENINDHSLNVISNNLFVVANVNKRLRLFHYDLDKVDEEYFPDYFDLDKEVSRVVSISYNNSKYALYYLNKDLKYELSVFDPKEETNNVIKTFKKDEYVYYNSIDLHDDNLYFSNYSGLVDGSFIHKANVINAKLYIYGIETKSYKNVSNASGYAIDGNNLYILGNSGVFDKQRYIYKIKK